jgi:hypothetical protein
MNINLVTSILYQAADLVCNHLFVQLRIALYLYTVGHATMNNATTNECYNEQFLSIKSGRYNERGGIVSADVAGACA